MRKSVIHWVRDSSWTKPQQIWDAWYHEYHLQVYLNGESYWTVCCGLSPDKSSQLVGNIIRQGLTRTVLSAKSSARKALVEHLRFLYRELTFNSQRRTAHNVLTDLMLRHDICSAGVASRAKATQDI